MTFLTAFHYPPISKGGQGGFSRFLSAVLAWLVGLGLAGWLNLTSATAQEPPASDLARRLGCFACHNPGPGHRAAPLDRVGAHLSREQLQIALTQPRQLHPGAKMPSYAYLPAAERQALLDFLEHLK
jgi:hypothetical protein